MYYKIGIMLICIATIYFYIKIIIRNIYFYFFNKKYNILCINKKDSIQNIIHNIEYKIVLIF